MADVKPVSLAATRGATELHTEPSALGVTAAGFVALSMLVVIAIMIWKKVPALVGGILDKRIATIRHDLDEASRLRAEAEALLLAAQQRTSTLVADAATIVDHARAEAAAMLMKAEADARELVARRGQMAEDKIGAAERSAIAEVRARAADAATRAAGATIAREHDATADRAIVDRTISSLGRPH
ncbi:hypothetical protein [uncultured Sphingomonas sp.]|uniref:F0F1 ATP synthase subunit B family protein n=1 Tax=uncultured Sphingomonas sp. TaxID=158754 RepID=UPI0035CA85D5